MSLNKVLVLVDVRCDEEKFNGLCNVVEAMQTRFRPTMKLFCPLFKGQDHSIGQERLKVLDEVAYVRFASVYRDFREAKDFEKFLGGLDNPLKDLGDTD